MFYNLIGTKPIFNKFLHIVQLSLMAEYARKNVHRKQIYHITLNMWFCAVSLDRYIYIYHVYIVKSKNKNKGKERGNTLEQS
jgi:hypothetical protein